MIRKRIDDVSTARHRRLRLWQKCTNFRCLKQIHASLIIKGFNSCPSALRELIFASAVAISGIIDYAHQVFAQIAEPDIFIWNTMMRGSAQSQNPSKTILLYLQMESRGIKPDNSTFSFLLKACTRLGWTNTGLCIHGKVAKYGFEENMFVRSTLIHHHANCGSLGIARAIFDDFAERDVVAWSALIAGYARRGQLTIARQLFDEMPTKDLVAWNVMITAYAKRGKMEWARRLFDGVPKRDVVTWNAMITGYVLRGENEQALQMFEEMRSVGEQPDEVTMLSLLSACADLGDLETGTKVHNSIVEMSSGNLGILLGNALVYMYAKCGSIERALEVFRGIREKDVSTWNSIIVGSAFHGHADESINLFAEMQKLKNIRPNEITFAGLLVACSHAGKVVEGHQYYKLMKDGYNIEPNLGHYGCMVDLLGRAGLLNDAFEFIENMKIEPNAVIWRTLLGACRIYGNVELGRQAHEKLLEMRSDKKGDYMLFSNIYAAMGEWDGAQNVRKLMDSSGARKEPGCSLIEADESARLQFLLDPNHKLNLKNQMATAAS
ncbi:pentatricopeptide repeat-containing protein At5g15300 [Manihot esculenta]|uniref:Uncharacterized protein n=2 Tax=Manihot esculenta TaxID=3983 RepID=A0ACB7IBS3_MANES|nr:pentatricopeptide repeat-containing protein At5g15300 [Manihot esculenta]KAG8662352.1 hypothetical protein MANES_01G093100v8 [Manihot esculenta]OAY60191.1 hypothetical protein MANES_01G093100v8 [Manihot esculenta]